MRPIRLNSLVLDTNTLVGSLMLGNLCESLNAYCSMVRLVTLTPAVRPFKEWTFVAFFCYKKSLKI